MPRFPIPEDVRSRAVEFGVYLPLGAYARVRDEIGTLNRARVERMFGDLIERGHERVEPFERAVRQRAGRVEGEARSTASSVRSDVSSQADRAQTTARKTQRKSASRAESVAAQAVPTMPRVAAPSKAGDLPISGYESLTANEITTRLSGLTQTDLARVYKYEDAHEGRGTILESIKSRFIELPIPTYDALTVEEINKRLEGLPKSELRTIRRYESGTKDRSTIIQRIDSLL